MKFYFKKSNNTAHTHRKRWVLLLILLLVIAPTATAQASVFDPLVKLFVPLYDKILGKEDPSEPSPNSDTDTKDSKDSASDTTAITATPSKSSTETKTPDLATVLLAEFAYDRGDIKTALELYKSQALKENATAVFERALEISIQNELPNQSLAFARLWQEKNPDHTPALFYATHLALKAEDYSTVSQNLRQILEYDPKADLGQLFAGIFPQNQETLRTLFYELQALDNDDNASLSVLKAGLLVRMNEPIPAILYLNNALKDEPNNLAYYLLKADILKTQVPPNATEKTNELIRFLKASQKTTTDNTKKQLYLYHIRYLIDNGDLEGAWKILTAIYKPYKDDNEVSMLAALVALDLNRPQEAATILSHLSTLSGDQSEAYYYLGVSLERSNRYQEALNAYKKVTDLQFVLNAVQKVVALELAFGNPDNAINALVNLRKKFEMYASDSYTLQAEILLRMGKKDEAKQLLTEAYQQFPDDTDLLYASTQLLDDVAEAEQKQKNLKELVSIEPDNIAYRLALADITLKNTPNDINSLDFVKKISQLTANDPEYDSTFQLQALQILAKNALQNQDYKAVIDYLETPYQIAPELNTGILLVRAYQGLGDSAMVMQLLDELKTRFGQNDGTAKPTEF